MGKAGIVVGIVGVVLLIAAMFGTWWSYSLTASALGQTATASADFGMFGGQVATTSPVGTTSQPINYSEMQNVQSAFQMTSILLLLALVLGIAFIAVGVLSWGRQNLRKAAGALGIVAFALALLAPIYLMSALPAAVSDDSGPGSTPFEVAGFWGSQTTTFLGVSATANWGPGWAWYLTLVASIILLAGAVVALRAPRPAAPVAGYAPYPGYAPPGPPMEPPMAPPPQQPPPPPPG